MVKATIGGIGVEIWFTPSFNIKTQSKELEYQLRNLDVEVYDIHAMRRRTVKVTKGEWEAYLVLEQLRLEFPKLKVVITEHPEVETFPSGETNKELLN